MGIAIMRLSPVRSLALSHFLVCTPACRRAWKGKEEHHPKCKPRAYSLFTMLLKEYKKNQNFNTKEVWGYRR